VTFARHLHVPPQQTLDMDPVLSDALMDELGRQFEDERARAKAGL
jgi:hypothetical protein